MADFEMENVFVNTFFLDKYHDRAMYELRSKKKRRSFIWKISHDMIKQSKLSETIKVSDYFEIEAQLKKLGAPEKCYVMSIDNEIDGTVLPLEIALQKIVGLGPSILCCKSGELAYLEEEQTSGAPLRYILA